MLRNFDFAGWVHRAEAFVTAARTRPGFQMAPPAAVAPPVLTPAAADALEGRLGRPLPAALRGFLERGAAALDCRYTFEYDPEDDAETEAYLALFPHETEVYGGARLGPAAELPAYARSAAQWARGMRDGGGSAAPRADVWAGSLPVIAVGNGDYVGLDLRAGAGAVDDAGDPPVVYLSHEEDAAPLLAPSFTGFLAAWERLCYLGPESWLLRKFRGADGFLDPDSDAAARLRQLLGA